MVDAGRILIMPKGIWSNLVSYEMLDVVTQDNIAYLARQSSVGVSPKNDSSYTYWQPFGTSVTPDGETIIMNSAGNITANIDNKSLIYDDVNMYVKVAIDGSTIKYDNSNGYLYVDASNFNINDLNNIAITSPADGQTLVYDSTTQKWKNGQGSVSPIDNLTSNSTTQPLSANQGRVLNNQKLEKEIISDAWNASNTYAVGQYCIYNNSLWKCLVQHSGQTPTEGTYWTNVTVANEITSVNNSFGGMKFGIDSDGNYGYIKAGADTVTPFSGKLTDLISKNHLSPYFAKTVVQAYSLFEYDANSGYMKLSRTGTGKCTVYGGILVDVTKYKSIKLTVKNKSVSNGTISVGISKNSSSDQQEFYSDSTGTTVVFDLTSYSGNYYIGIRNYAFNSSLLIEKLELF